ncbi:unnamed protein product [Ceratitis capitata]|uniref:F-box/WD repeat-containing protein 7 n=3 Tax=Ceratitis capitata TaxID=7213 RepID=A0A811V158_CERCA|nr:unnamed protein product [Ceratitis capitata]
MLTDEAEPFGRVDENNTRNANLEDKSSVLGSYMGVDGNDRMSFRLKKMNISNTVTKLDRLQDNHPCSSSGNENKLNALTKSSVVDIEAMDLVERSDFEEEQRLTGGIILKNSTVAKKNMLNLRLVKSTCLQNQQNNSGGQQESLELGDDCPSSSSNINKSSHSNGSGGGSGRAVSSDSKCAYKDLVSTPTSSRIHNSRLTKSTAKLNLCSSLSHPQHRQAQLLQERTKGANNSKTQHKSQQIGKTNSLTSLSSSSHTFTNSIASSSTSASTSSASSSTSSSSSSVIVEVPTAASTSSLSIPSTTACTAGGGSGAEIYSNSNSNDSLMSSIATTVHCRQRQQQHTIGSVDRTEVGGCSRTSSIHAAVAEAADNAAGAGVGASAGSAVLADFDDAQPSTSSARCHYAPSTKSLRQVNASAQTNERYLGSGSSGANATLNPPTTRSRRRAELAAQLTRTTPSDEALSAAFKAIAAAVAANLNDEVSWADCDETTSDEEICTCIHSSSCSVSNSSHGGSNTSLNETDIDTGDMSSGGIAAGAIGTAKDGDLSNYIQMVSISEEVASNNGANLNAEITTSCAHTNAPQRKRKYDSRLLDTNASAVISNNANSASIDDANGRKRIAYDLTSTPRLSSALVNMPSTSSTQLVPLSSSTCVGRRTPRSIIPTRENPPPELQQWLSQFQRWTHVERLLAIDRLIEYCEPTQVRHMMKVIEPQFQRDFISLLPRELALQVLAYLDPKDLLRAAQTCRSWRFLCDDNLLWKEKCRKAQILTEPRKDRPKRGRAGNMPPIASPWKAAYMRQHIIEMNWRSRPIREPKVLKGHDDHVITCLQFSGNRIVSGSDDNTLKVWSAVTGKCLRTLVGHTGGVWSSQMSGNIIISGSTDRTLKVWDMDTGQCLHTLLGHTSTVRCMHLHGKKVVSGSRDATLRVWDIEQGTCLHVLVGHLAAVRCVQYDGKLIVSGAYDYMVKIWHPERQECLHTLSGHSNRVYSLQFDGVHVVSGSLDTSIRVWDVESGNLKHILMGHQSLTSGMELRQNILVSGNADSTVKVWDITTGQCLQTLSGPNKHQSAVTCLQFNSRFVVTSSDDGTVKLWDVKTGEFIRNLVALDSGGSGGVVWRIRANDTKLICAVGSRNGTEETKLMVLDFDVEGACVKCS